MVIKKLIKAKQKVRSLFHSAQAKRHALVGPAHLWKMKQSFQITFLKNKALKPEHKLLDIGCGTLRGGVPIIDYLETGNYCGVEVRKEVLAEGKKELAAHQLEHKNPNLINFNKFSDIKLDTKFDFIFSFAVLIHLSDDIANSCFEFASKRLADKGVFYANVNVVKHDDSDWQGFPVVFRSVEFYEKMAAKYGLTVKPIGTLTELGHISGSKLADAQIMLEIRKA